MNEPYMTTNEVAIYINMHPVTVRLKASRHEIPTSGRAGRGYRFRKSSIDAWIRQNGGR